jgi:hypothetical protein
MAYFAQLDENNIVTQVISISNEDAPDPAPDNSEPLGQDFIANVLNLPGVWRQTSYNNSFRKQYCGPGFSYDEAADVFISPRPFDSWQLDENYDWQAPTPYPQDGNIYTWNEETLSWNEVPSQ